MPRGRGKNYKGRTRHFTSADEIDRQMNDDSWRRRRDEAKNDNSDEEANSTSDSEEEDEKGNVRNLIEIENPNRVQNKLKKANELDTQAAKPELSRREREAIEKEQARLRYEKLHAEGKTDEAKADLARLAIIRKQREEAAKKKEQEKTDKEDKLKAAEEARKAAMEAQMSNATISGKAGRRKKR